MSSPHLASIPITLTIFAACPVVYTNTFANTVGLG
jgi:hypothetical protein